MKRDFAVNLALSISTRLNISIVTGKKNKNKTVFVICEFLVA